MSDQPKDSKQQTVEDTNKPVHDPQARKQGFVHFAMVLCILALMIAIYLKLEAANAILSAGTR